MKEKIIYTIGHSTHSLEEFLAMLQSFRIELLADIRSYPGSRKYPHFNKEMLPAFLAKNNIEYIHLRDLGGRRKVNPDSCNTGWGRDTSTSLWRLAAAPVNQRRSGCRARLRIAVRRGCGIRPVMAASRALMARVACRNRAPPEVATMTAVPRSGQRSHLQ